MSADINESQQPALATSTKPDQTSKPPSVGPSLTGPDIEEAYRFLAALAPDDFVTFQTLPERKQVTSEKIEGCNRIFHDRFTNRTKTLIALNEAGSGIFVMVNRGSGDRKSTSVTDVRAIFVDLDGADLQPVLKARIPPSITVESSPGRYHAYWLVRDVPLQDFKPAQQALAAMFGGDKAVCDLPRLMRLPGFYHQKGPNRFRSRLLSCEPELVWGWHELAEGLDLPGPKSLPDVIPEGARNNTIFKLATAAAMTGTALSQSLEDLFRINRERCHPPLAETEVKSLVEHAYISAPEPPMKVPTKLLGDARFLSLTPGQKCLMLLIHQRFTNKNKASEIAVLWKDFRQHFPREKTFKKYRSALTATGLLELTKKAMKKRDDGKTDWNLYKLAITTGM